MAEPQQNQQQNQSQKQTQQQQPPRLSNMTDKTITEIARRSDTAKLSRKH